MMIYMATSTHGCYPDDDDVSVLITDVEYLALFLLNDVS
jgi:hypothetical protein